MPTTFTVFSLGKLADIDTKEGNTTAENASALVGKSFGEKGAELAHNAQTFSPGKAGFDGTTKGVYDQTSKTAETFRINDGDEQTFDATAVYSATITYVDGTTATISAVVFQDTMGNTYLAPEFSANSDQDALEAGVIRSLSLDKLIGDNYSGMTADRQAWKPVSCYVGGTRILTPEGEIRIEHLSIGDNVSTRDHGSQQIRWIGSVTVPAIGKLAPVKIARGALGVGIPARDLYVSRQHRMLLISKVAAKMLGKAEVLMPAIKLVGLPGVDLDLRHPAVTYHHILLDRHEILYAEGAPSESFLIGPQARAAMSKDNLEELEALFPGVMTAAAQSARPIVDGRDARGFLQRQGRNGKALVMLPHRTAGRSLCAGQN